MTGRQASGFTLIETLVALVVLGCLILGLTHGVRFGLLAWQAEARISGGDAELDAVDRTLRHIIEAMDPGSGDEPPVLAAGRTALRLVTALPEAASAAGAGGSQVEAELLVDGGHGLVLRWRPYLHAERLRPPPPMIETALLPGVVGLDLAYWRPGVGWTAAWPYRGLPALVRLRLVFADGDARRWPDIVAAPLLDRS